MTKNDSPAPSKGNTPVQTSRSLEEIYAIKKAKVADLRARGIDPYPARTERTHTCGEVLEIGKPLEPSAGTETTVAVAGRLLQLRDMGKTIFAHIQDTTGRCQLFLKKDNLTPEAFQLVKKDLHAGDFISASGVVFKTRTGETSVRVAAFTLLSKALRPLPEKWHGLKDVETRYRHRHLDLLSNPEVKKQFENRSLIISTIRNTFSSLGFLEVETPILLPQAGGASARPFLTHHNALNADMALRIATELHLKRLIIGGLDKVYEIGRVFRNEGLDTKHNPEFTMLEAYEAYSDYEGMARLFERIMTDCAQALGVTETTFDGKTISLKAPFKRLYLPEVWKDKCGEPITNILEGKGFNRNELKALADRVGVPSGNDTPSAKLFERIFDARIMPLLDQPTFVFDHPTAITPLAKLKPGAGDSIVERFECFAAGQELSNAYTELNDPQDQMERLQEQARQASEEKNEETDVLDGDFVTAMEAGMPPTGGIGIGIDRIVMLLTGQASIRDVILFPALKPEVQETEDSE